VADAELIRRRFSVVLERTVRELRGLSCLALEEVAQPKQQIMSSRSFSRLLTERRELEEAVASYMATAAEKLRRQRCLAGVVQVYIRTNIFKPDEPQYQQSMALPLPAPSDDTRVLTAWALRILRRIYRDGYAYHKAGIMLLDLIPLHQRQASLFGVDQDDGGRPEALMQVLDEINTRYGRRTLQFAVEGITRPWQMRRNRLSPGYTTRWDELPAVLAR
jgi:DNA polymerase V